MHDMLKCKQINGLTGTLLFIILLFTMPPLPNIVSANPDETSLMTYGSCILIIPRGTVSDNVTWKYVNNTQSECGWNVNLEYDDAKWLEGKTPIGPPRYFVRTNVSLREIRLRKIFQVQDIPRNAFLNIAVYGDIDVWINGRKILSSIDTLHMVFYWNYKLNITEHLKDGENLLAIQIKTVGEAYFDCELSVEYKSLNKRVEESVKDRQNIDGSFYEEYYYGYPLVTISYATSILKALGRIDLVEKEKIMGRIMSYRTVDGDFSGGNYFAVEALKNIGIPLPSFDAEYLARKVLQCYWTESYQEYDLSYTYYTLKTLESLNALNKIGNTSSIIKTILALQCSSGLFLNPMHGNAPDMMATFYALSSLDILNALDLINKTKVTESIIADYNEEKKFYYWCSVPYSFMELFGSVKSLELLDSLGRIDADEIAQLAISCIDKAFLPDYCQPYNDRYHYQFHVFFNFDYCQPYNGGSYCESYRGLYFCPFYIGNPLETEYYLVEILKALDRLCMLNVTALTDYLTDHYNLIDGSFKSGGDLVSTERAVRILNNLARLNIIDKERLIQYVLPTQSLTICDEDNIFCDISEVYSPVYILATIGASEKINRSRLISKLANHQNPDGGFASYENKGTFKFESSLSATCYVAEILNMLNMFDSFDVEKIKNYILSLKNPDGGFGQGVKDTAMAVITLILLGEKDEIEEETVQHILNGQGKDGSFGDLSYTYFSLRALKMLNRLDDVVFSRAVNYVLQLWNPYDGFGELSSTDYAIGILSLREPKRYYVKIDSNPESASHGVFGSGWYYAGMSATLSIDASIICNPHKEGEIFIFKGWSGDIVSESQRVNITVDSNKSIIANWKTRYLVTYYGPSPLSTAKHEEWFDEGEVFRINTTEVFDNDIMSDYVFDHWEVDGKTVNGSTLEIEVDSPKEIRAVYRIELNLVKTVLTLLRASLISIAILVAAAKLASTIGKIRKKHDKPAVNKPETV